MKKLAAMLANESVLLLGLTASILTALQVSGEWTEVIQAAIPLLLSLAVRQITTSPATVAEMAEEVAVETAAALSEVTVGTLGEVTGLGVGIARDTAKAVVKGVGGLVPALVDP